MNNDLTVKNALIIFERPLVVQSRLIYGLAYNIEKERINTENGNDISIFIGYLTAADYWERNGGTIGKNTWITPGKKMSFVEDISLIMLVSNLLKGAVGWETMEFSFPIEIREGELDKDDPCLVISRELIQRYYKEITKISEDEKIE